MPKLEKYSLGLLPTPLQELRNFSNPGGTGPIYMKRDDLFGRFVGGNKLRKMEYILPVALAEGADTLITTGTFESNHVCASALAARIAGLDAVNVLMGGRGRDRVTFNERLQDKLGVRIERVLYDEENEEERRLLADNVSRTVDSVTADLRGAGKAPFFVIAAGGGVEGGYAYFQAFEEMNRQMNDLGHREYDLYVPVGTGSTYAGLWAGIAEAGANVRLSGISIARREPRLREETLKEVVQLCEFLDLPAPRGSDLHLDERFVGYGYGKADEGTRAAVGELLRLEGIPSDLTYSGKAFGGMLRLLKDERRENRPVVFWHTGGVSGFFDWLSHE